MVKTRIDLKAKIKEKLESIDEPFKTNEIVEFAKEVAPNVWTSPHRIAKYIKAADIAEFDKSKKVWRPKEETPKTKPTIFGGMKANAEKRP